MKTRICLTLFLLSEISTVFAQDRNAEAMARLNVVLPANVEEQLALSALPEPLRSGASVYVYEEKGFVQTKAGTNGFTCFVNRDGFFYGASAFKPTCWDYEGTTTYVPVMLKVGEMLAAEETFENIRAAIEQGFADGSFRAPTTGGVAYMLAGDLELNPASGAIIKQQFPGHYMFYAVNATNEQLGYSREAAQGLPSMPSIFAAGAGGEHGLSYIIVVPADHH